MRRLTVLMLLIVFAMSAAAGTKDKGTTVLKDVQPAHATDKKQKNQRFDLSFVTTSGKDYVCRTEAKTKIKATELVVGSTVIYEIENDKGKLKTSAGKKLNCTIVRVANATSTPN